MGQDDVSRHHPPVVAAGLERGAVGSGMERLQHVRPNRQLGRGNQLQPIVRRAQWRSVTGQGRQVEIEFRVIVLRWRKRDGQAPLPKHHVVAGNPHEIGLDAGKRPFEIAARHQRELVGVEDQGPVRLALADRGGVASAPVFHRFRNGRVDHPEIGALLFAEELTRAVLGPQVANDELVHAEPAQLIDAGSDQFDLVQNADVRRQPQLTFLHRPGRRSPLARGASANAEST